MITAERFNMDIRSLMNNNMSAMEAIIHYCELNDIEYVTVKSLIGGDLKRMLRNEAEELNFLPKTSKLPI